MPLFKEEQLKRKVQNTSEFQKTRYIEESRKHETYDIFLSHSYLDKEIVYGLFLELTQKGFTVYVDWIVDPSLDRQNVTKESAELIRKRMKSSKSLLLAISSNIALSKWVPWELGFVDGKTNKCAIIPISNEKLSEKTFKRFEYLLLYPYVKLADFGNLGNFYVVDGPNNYEELKNWNKLDLKLSVKSVNIDVL